MALRIMRRFIFRSRDRNARYLALILVATILKHLPQMISSQFGWRLAGAVRLQKGMQQGMRSPVVIWLGSRTRGT
jgi:hypothetical protein